MGLFIGWKSGALVKHQTSHVMKNPGFCICEKQRGRPTCESVQSDHRLCKSLPRQNNASNFYIRNSKPLVRIVSGANQFEFYLAENPEGRFSRYEAQMINIERAGTGQHKRSNEPHREITKRNGLCAQQRLRSAWASALSD